MGSDQDFVNTGLVLGLGFSSPIEEIKPSSNQHLRKIHQPSLTLSLSGDAGKKADSDYVNRPDHSAAAASSFSNISVKRERDLGGGEEAEIERVSSRISDEDDDGSNGRKKLRLSKAQSALLEESFKRHSTLNPKQKQELARELKLRPRQVEVWFQNRRARLILSPWIGIDQRSRKLRTKLKQTEVDCEFLKKCCETLTGENQRLQKELQELKALKLAQPLYMKFPAATLTMCPSCERIVHGAGAGAGAGTAAVSSAYTLIASRKPHFYYNHFTNEPAAC